MKRRRVLVYPCGTEIGLEIYKAAEYSTHFELWGGSSNYDHGRYAYRRHIDNLPFVSDKSDESEVREFRDQISGYNIDFIYPAMDGVLYKLSEYSHIFPNKIVAPNFDTAKVTRSKKSTYQLLGECISVPKLYDTIDEIDSYPVFVKPDVGQGSNGAQKINNRNSLESSNLEGMLIMKYLPGEEYTVDCFTNGSGKLIYAAPRCRKRIKNGISVSSMAATGSEFTDIALKINANLNQRGGWFFQVKRDASGKLVLLEVASRIAGTSAYTRSKGVNLPLLTLYLYSGQEIDYVQENAYEVVIDRALGNSYATDLQYDKVYVDYDDTMVFDGKVNVRLAAFLYQCVNNKIPIILLTKHAGDIAQDLEIIRLNALFDEIIHIGMNENKYEHMTGENPILIDDSFGERKSAHDRLGIQVFDTHMVEFLLNPLKITNA
jgi:hypothetical protein